MDRDRFDPHQIQAEYLKEVGFRESMIVWVGRAIGTMGPDLLFSEENEEARKEADAWLGHLFFSVMNQPPPMHSPGYIAETHARADAFLKRYGFDPLTLGEIGLPDRQRGG